MLKFKGLQKQTVQMIYFLSKNVKKPWDKCDHSCVSGLNKVQGYPWYFFHDQQVLNNWIHHKHKMQEYVDFAGCENMGRFFTTNKEKF